MLVLGVVLLPFFSTSTFAHVALWDPSLFGFDGVVEGVVDYNNNLPVQPLRLSDGYTEEQWFGHGFKGFPPADGIFMELPAGGTYHGQVSANRAGTTYRDPSRTDAFEEHAAGADDAGSLHTIINFGEDISDKLQYLGGTSLSIAYLSDIDLLKPSDLVVFSVNASSVWWREVDYQVPEGLPAWTTAASVLGIGFTPPVSPSLQTSPYASDQHLLPLADNVNAEGRGEGYPFEMYQLLYRCKVTGVVAQTGTEVTTVAAGQLSTLCESNPSTCVVGAKQPHYWSQASGNNNFDADPPTHNARYGFTDGAQNDIFLRSATTTDNGTFTTTHVATPTESSLGASALSRRNRTPDAKKRWAKFKARGSHSALKGHGSV
ncbi:hypothetical protein BDY24DRAFT_417621 [Mrakia frigida]|uniref:uncharacterized protein n=1 Tax=Mrakia frigida TaxID=29902 RepID=UPI003FCC1D18